ncbi:MAG: AMP-binding protein [Beutenbergiaceae bacterium]
MPADALSWSPNDGIDALLGPLRAALDGGPAVVIGAPVSSPVPASTAIVLRTSGSAQGPGRPVALGRDALSASAHATHDRLGGAGCWVVALSPTHIGGLQTVIRSMLAGHPPVRMTSEDFDTAELARTITTAPEAPYLSLVPTQLFRALRSPQAQLALGQCRAVLIGGAALPPTLAERALDAGIKLVTSYGMTETSGGCIYDGVPLAHVQVRLAERNRIQIAGPTLMSGYLDEGPQPFYPDGDVRWFGTHDIGELDSSGRLQVIGRADDMLISGGLNVHPDQVERLLAPLGELVVVGVPDAEWGTLVTVVTTTAHSLAAMREAVGGGPRAPRAVVRVDALPLRGPGKIDRQAATTLATRILGEGGGQRL